MSLSISTADVNDNLDGTIKKSTVFQNPAPVFTSHYAISVNSHKQLNVSQAIVVDEYMLRACYHRTCVFRQSWYRY